MADVGLDNNEVGFWAGKRVLVTGAGGFLGSWLARALVDNEAKVWGLDINWSTSDLPGGVVRVTGDVRDQSLICELITSNRIDAVIHLAAQSLVQLGYEDPAGTFDTNARGTWTLLEACRIVGGVRSIIVASSDKAYGDAGGKPYDEAMGLMARHSYAASKACTDIVAQSYAESYAQPIAIMRCGNLYGGGDLNWSRLVPGTIRSVFMGDAPVIRSDGKYVRDYLYIDDAVRAVLLLGASVGSGSTSSGAALNFASAERLTVIQVVDKILHLMGASFVPIIKDEAVNEIREQRVSPTKAKQSLGWVPQASFDEGIQKTVRWYQEFLERAQ